MIIGSIAVMNTISCIPGLSHSFYEDDNFRLTQSAAVNNTMAPAW